MKRVIELETTVDESTADDVLAGFRRVLDDNALGGFIVIHDEDEAQDLLGVAKNYVRRAIQP